MQVFCRCSCKCDALPSYQANQAYLCVLVEEEECIGHIVVPQVDDAAAHPCANG